MSTVTVNELRAGANFFRYKATGMDGVVVHGTVHALNESAATAVLHGQGLFPLHIIPTRAAARRRPPRGADLAVGLRVLSNLLAAGIPMSRTLATFEELAPRSWRPPAAAMRERIRVGGRLADALAEDAGLPAVLVGVIAAGEASGAVAEATARSAELAEESSALRSAIQGALIYPAILFVAGACSVGLLVGVVLPRFADILADLGQEPPALTRLVLSLAAAVQHGGLVILAVAMLAIGAWRMWVGTESGHVAWDAIMLRVPVIGAVRCAAATSRVCIAMAALLDAGVPVSPALMRATGAAGDAAIQARLTQARADIVRGEPLGLALDSAQALSTSALRLVRAGEESGHLGAMFIHAGRMEGARARDLTRGAVRLLEPALILVFGAVVALVSGALLQAVYAVRPVH